MDGLANRFNSHDSDTRQVQDMEIIRTFCLSVANIINKIVPESREKSLALTKLEEVMFWSNAGISRNNTKED